MLTGFNSFKVFLVAILILFSSAGFGQQNLSYKAMLDTNSILIGDQVAMRILVTHSNRIKIGFPIYKDSLMHGIEVLADFPVDTIAKEGDQVSLSKAYLLTSFDSGSYTIPEPRLLLLLKGAKADTIITELLHLKVNTIAIDTTKAVLRDIKPPMKAPITFSEIAPWLFGGIGFLALLALVAWFIIRRIQNKPLLSIAKTEEPADVQAIRLLTNLRQEKLWQNNKFKQYHSNITEIIRVYIYRTQQINALEQTSEETLQSIRNQNVVTTENQTLLRTIFTIADLTKFAKYTPTSFENEESINYAETFVRNTKVFSEVTEDESTVVEKNNESKPDINSSK